jgi:UPF0042 nucleotide-binding protein
VKSKLVIVTGISGSGKTHALKTFEDLKFEAVDNIPLTIIPALIQNSKRRNFQLALGLDIRNRDFDIHSSLALIEKLKQDQEIEINIIFLDCEDDILIRRYSENRRSHPITSLDIMEAIQEERKLISYLKEKADYVIDTSKLSIIDLRKILKNYLKGIIEQDLLITLKSFSYKLGIPRESDLVLDVRFLKNPYYKNSLKDLDGRALAIREYLLEDKVFNEFMDKIKPLLLFLLPQYKEEGKSYLTISIGCTGGKHRSVLVAELLMEFLKGNNYKVNLLHKDITMNDKS